PPEAGRGGRAAGCLGPSAEREGLAHPLRGRQAHRRRRAVRRDQGAGGRLHADPGALARRSARMDPALPGAGRRRGRLRDRGAAAVRAGGLRPERGDPALPRTGRRHAGEGVMIRAIVPLAVLAVAAVLLYAASRPDSFRVERAASIRAPAAKVHALIADLHEFNTWNPYVRKDPNLKGRYRGAAAGPGSAYDFEGNHDVGRGSLEIVESTPPTRVAMKIDMVAPFEAHNL